MKTTVKTTASKSELRFPFLAWLMHPLSMFVLATAAIVVGSGYAWRQWQSILVNAGDVELTAERVQISAPNRWVPEDPQRRLIEELRVEQKTLLDLDLVPAVVRRLQAMPYIEAIQKVHKSAAGLNIEALYRRPVGAVDLGNGQWQLVDRLGIAIGTPTIIESANDEFLRINVYSPNIYELEEWEKFPDIRIRSAASICDELAGTWSALGLYRVVSFCSPNLKNAATATFELWTANGGKIVWSDADSSTSTVRAEQKLVAIKDWIAVNGPLDKLAGWKMLDVRTGTATLIPAQQAANEAPGESRTF